jgi:DNA-binding transcriptional MerR regulator
VPTVDLLSDDLSIGELATLSGLSIHTLRYYERIALIEAVPRASSGHRRYSRRTVQRAEALGYLRATGLGIEDMRSYLRDVDAGDAADVAALLSTHAQRIAEQIKELKVRRAYIAAKAAYWQAVAEGRGDSAAAQCSLDQARHLSEQLK